jgi:cyclopropane-fatty-acyl-phospholipid synthase
VPAAPATTRDARFSAPAAAQILFALLDRLRIGAVELSTPDGRTRVFGPGGAPAQGAAATPAAIALHDWRVASDALTGGDVAFAEAYIEGRFETPDLTHLLTVLAANQAPLERAFYGNVWMRSLLRLRHLLRSNTRRGARKNIVAHYDLGNDFYALWLDPTMTYSSALFGDDREQSLQNAQRAKCARVLAELALPPGAHVLEIGCGWGGFALEAARAELRVTGISLSHAQTAYAQALLARAGFADRVQLRLQDYRDVAESFDAVASIEMFEAVGERWWPAYFHAIRRALVPGGRACIQAITIAAERFDRYRAQSDFVQQYVFPGGMLAAPARLIAEARSAGLDLLREHRFGRDYAETLKRWRIAFDAHVGDVRTLGFDEKFIRCWRFYLAYCAAGFATQTTDVAQYTFVRR